MNIPNNYPVPAGPCEVTMKLRHYGSPVFRRESFRPIEDKKDRWVKKPLGGLWTSPFDSKYGWREWCRDENFHVSSLDVFFDVEIAGRVLVIDCEDDLTKLPWTDAGGVLFTSLLEHWDAIHLTENGQNETRYSCGHDLYGWDCESVLVMNPDCIRPLAMGQAA